MSKENYFDRLMPRRSLAGFRSSSSTINDRGIYSSPLKQLRQHYFYDTKFHPNKVFSSSSSLSSPPPPPPQPPSSLPTMIVESSAPLPRTEPIRERTRSKTRSPARSQTSSPHFQSSIDLMATSLKCDDCQTNDGLFQCCHCNQRLCIRCCNKHYKKVTIELERLHELSDRLVAKIIHTKNDLERQKNETLEQCHKWRVDTINTINKAHSLIVQTIHDEYETLGKEFELFVQKEMASIHIDQNELMRMKKNNVGSLLSTPSNLTTDSTNSIDTIRKRIEAFAKTIDETGKFSFQVKLPSFDIDDSLRVESRFGDITRSTSATWQNVNETSFSEEPNQDDELTKNVQENDILSNHSTNEEIKELFDKIEDQEFDVHSRSNTPSPSPSSHPKSETNNSNLTSSSSSSPPPPLPSTRYAFSVENDIELQQQQYYSPSFRNDRYDSAYGTAPPSPNSSLNNVPPSTDHHSSASSLHEQSSKRFSFNSNNDFGSFYNNRRHTHAFNRTSSRSNSPNHNNNDEDTYRSIQHVQLKREQDGSLEGVSIQIEQSHNNDGTTERRRTCMQACGVRRRTTVLPPRPPPSSSNSDRSSDGQSWLYYRTHSTPTFTQ